MKRNLRIVIGALLVSIACFGAFVAGVAYINSSAERRAHDFCDLIPIGSAISSATAKATNEHILWGGEGGYTFYFSGVIFDKAVCEVSVDKDGNVTLKKAEMEYD